MSDTSTTTEPSSADASTTTESATDASTGAAEPPYDCPYCDRRFHRESYLSLHRGQTHPDRLTDAERAAFDAAREAEEEQLRLFRLQALAALVFIYFGFLMVYAFSL